MHMYNPSILRVGDTRAVQYVFIVLAITTSWYLRRVLRYFRGGENVKCKQCIRTPHHIFAIEKHKNPDPALPNPTIAIRK